MRRFAVVTLGSAGDLHPFLAIARALAERGHEVHLLTQPAYEDAVRAEGVGFVSIVSQKDHDRTLQHPLLWHPLHGFGVLWRHLAVPAIGSTLEALERLSSERPRDQLVVLASPLAVGARLARERRPGRIRLVSGYTAPMGLRHTEDPLFLGGWQVPRWVPYAVRQALWASLDRWKLEPLARPALSEWCMRLGLPPLGRSTFGVGLHSPDGGLALYPDWFAAAPPAWRARGVQQVGFPIFEPGHTHVPTAPLAEFLASPAPYVVVYPGSADKRAHRFASHVIDAGGALGWRTLVLSRFVQAPSSPQTLHIEHASLPRVLPGAAAFVHHGGIGSVAQGLAARVPQLILASAYDQFENGARIEQLNVGQWQRETRTSASDVRGALAQLSAHPPGEFPVHLQASKAGAPNAAVRNAVELLQTWP